MSHAALLILSFLPRVVATELCFTTFLGTQALASKEIAAQNKNHINEKDSEDVYGKKVSMQEKKRQLRPRLLLSLCSIHFFNDYDTRHNLKDIRHENNFEVQRTLRGK